MQSLHTMIVWIVGCPPLGVIIRWLLCYVRVCWCGWVTDGVVQVVVVGTTPQADTPGDLCIKQVTLCGCSGEVLQRPVSYFSFAFVKSPENTAGEADHPSHQLMLGVCQCGMLLSCIKWAVKHCTLARQLLVSGPQPARGAACVVGLAAGYLAYQLMNLVIPSVQICKHQANMHCFWPGTLAHTLQGGCSEQRVLTGTCNGNATAVHLWDGCCALTVSTTRHRSTAVALPLHPPVGLAVSRHSSHPTNVQLSPCHCI